MGISESVPNPRKDWKIGGIEAAKVGGLTTKGSTTAARACQRLKGFHGVPMVAIAQLEFHVPAPHPLRQAVVLGKPHLGLQQPDLAKKWVCLKIVYL